MTLGFTHNLAGQIAGNTRSNDAYAWTSHYTLNRAYTANGLNRYTAITGSTTPTYDGRGNLTSANGATYGYDSGNMLTGVNGVPTLSYDPMQRLYETVGGGATTRMAYDGQSLIAEYNASNTLLRRYVHGPGVDEPLVWYEGTGTSDRRWLHADERGSIVAVSNGSGTVTNINAYDEYGIPRSTNIGRFQYTGQQWIAEFGMYHYKARTYSPTLGRFVQPDPIGYDGGMNLYAYVLNDPVNLTDELGLTPATIDAPEEDCVDDCAGGPVVVVTGTRTSPEPPPTLVTASLVVTTTGIGSNEGARTGAVECPVAAPAVPRSGFGPRRAPTRGASTNHNGQDFRNRAGAPVYSTQNGRVSAVFYHHSGGNSIIIGNSDGSRSGYGHTRALREISRGRVVSAGQQIGVTDRSGTQTAPHLHYTYTPPGTNQKADPNSQLGNACR